MPTGGRAGAAIVYNVYHFRVAGAARGRADC